MLDKKSSAILVIFSLIFSVITLGIYKKWLDRMLEKY